MIKKFILIIILTFSLFSWNYVFSAWENIDWRVKIKSVENDTDNDHLEQINNPNFVEPTSQWAAGVKDFIIAVAKDVKNLFYILSTIFFLIISVRFFFSGNSEEWFTKFKKWVLWITLWLVLMQVAYSFAVTVFDKSTWSFISSIVQNIFIPIVNILSLCASIFFVIIAIYAFIRIVSSNWEKENVKKWINAIVYAIIWLLLVKFATKIITLILGNYDVSSSWMVQFKNAWWLSWLVEMFLNIINWVNSFVAIVTIIMIMYAWMLIILSDWDEEKLKKWRTIIIYAFIWIFILVASYWILTFFIWPWWSKLGN